MVHKIVSFYHKNLNPEIKILQKKVFDHFDINLIQFEFDGSHPQAIEFFLENNKWDLITLFDVDCIPTENKVITEILEIVDDNTIYGNAQFSNCSPYVGPSFMSFTKKLYENSNHKKFHDGYYLCKNGVETSFDCGEIFVKENLKKGNKQVLSYPTSVIKKKWRFDGDETFPKFEFGVGTLFDNKTFHCFQIRFKENQNIFKNYVNELLNEKS